MRKDQTKYIVYRVIWIYSDTSRAYCMLFSKVWPSEMDGRLYTFTLKSSRLNLRHPVKTLTEICFCLWQKIYNFQIELQQRVKLKLKSIIKVDLGLSRPWYFWKLLYLMPNSLAYLYKTRLIQTNCNILCKTWWR